MKKIILLIIGLILVIGSILILNRSTRGFNEPKLSYLVENTVGTQGPIVIEFPQPMLEDTVEKRFDINPKLNGIFRWHGSTLYFFPTEQLDVNKRYQISISGGVETKDGRIMERSWKWIVRTRQPEILYLDAADHQGSIWRSDISGDNKNILIERESEIYDYSVSRDGGLIIYSLLNKRGGYNLWFFDRINNLNRMLLDCGTDWCTESAIAPDRSAIAYRREVFDNGKESTEALSGLNLLEKNISTDSYSIQSMLHSSGINPVWSPDGKYLAYFDQAEGVITVQDIRTKEEILLPSNYGVTGSWSPDGSKLAYVASQESELEPINNIFIADFNTRRIDPLFEEIPDRVEYGSPVWSSDGNWLAIGLRSMGGSFSRQIWVFGMQNASFFQIDPDERYTHSSPRWSPASNMIVYQRFELGDSEAEPEVFLWEMGNDQARQIEVNVALPKWLP